MAGFECIRYVDPFAPLPIGASKVGVLVDVANPTGLAGEVAYGRLLGNQFPLAYAEGTENFVQVVNTEPLVPGVAYWIQVLYDKPGKDPERLNWEHKGPITAPVVAHQGSIDAAQVTDTGLIVTWQTAASSSVPGALIEIVDLTSNELLEGSYLGTATTTSLTVSFAAGHSYGVRISAVQPAVFDSAGGFGRPFSYGSPTVPQPIPTAAPTLSRLSCAATGISAQWTAPQVAPHSGLARYEILLLDGAKLIGGAPAGDSGGQLATGELTALADPRLASRVSYGSLVGPIGSSSALFPRAPQIVSVTVTGTTSATITAELASPGALPAGGVLLATLYRDGVPGETQTLTSATGSVSWTHLPVIAGVSHAIDVALQVSSDGAPSLGAPSPRVPVPLIAPTGLVAGYDGQQLSIDLAFPAGQPVDGFDVTLTGTDGGRQLIRTGPQLPITFTTNLDLGQTWTAEVVPVLGIVSARSGTAPVTLPPVSAPVLTRVDYDGAELSLQWTAARLPYLSGYQVAVSGGPTLVVGGQQTSCVLPLAPAQATGASVTVTGLSTMRDTEASGAVPVLTSSIEVSSVTVAAEVVASWTVEPAAPAVRAVLMLGSSVVSTVPNAGPTGVSFAAPAPAGQPFTLVAYPVSADGVATGPACAPVELILTAPAIESGLLDAGQLSLRWNPVNSFGVTGYRLTATPTAGDPASLLVTGTSYDGPVPAAFTSPGVLAVTPVGARCTGPAGTAVLLAPASVSTAIYAGGQLQVTADLSTVDAGDTSWLEVLANGAPLARQVLAGAARPPFTVPVALPSGATAAVRISIGGPASLAPASTPVTVPTRIPVVLGAAYDGSALHVHWTPTGEAGVTGYLVSVAGTSAPDTYVAGPDSDSATIPVSLSYPFPSGATVSVRAVAGAPDSGSSGQGQPSSGTAPTLAGNCYSVIVTEAGYSPYLYRRGIYQQPQAVAGQQIVLYLAKPFSGTGNPTVSSTDSVFQLTPRTGGGDGLPYQLTLSATVWDMGNKPVRSGLRTIYNEFLTEVENAQVTPWAIGLLRQLIAQAMPQLFEEVLFYRYGYWRSDSLRVVDLMPGTRLQVSDALYQTVVSTKDARNGFVAVGNQVLEVVDAIPQGGEAVLPPGAGRILSVDALFSLIYPGGVAQDPRPIAAGPIDFFTANNRQSFYRLFYPAAFPPSDSNGSSALTSNITLVGTTSWAELDRITYLYEATGNFPSGDYFAIYFRGRSGLTPLINLSIQGQTRWTALGTSVRQALTSIGLAPFWSGDGGGLVSLRRASANLFSYPTPDDGLAMDQVDLTSAELKVVPMYWPLDMPLVGGDQLAVRQPPMAGGPA
jgi:hypothetical protein